MATVRKRNGLFQVQIRLKGFQPESRSFPTRSHAKAWGEAREAELRAGKTDTGKGVTLRNLLTEYPCSQTNREILTTFKKRCTFLDLSLDKLSRPHWLALRTSYLETQTPLSWNRSFKGIRGAVKWAVDAYNLSTLILVPLEKLSLKAKDVRRTRRLLPHEEAKLRAVLSPRENLILTILLDTGMRIGELTKLRKEWVEGCMIHIPAWATKTKNPRTVVVGPEAKVVTVRLIETIGENSLPATVDQNLRRAIKRVKLVDFRIHDLRHEALSRMAEEGKLSVTEMMNQSGHRNMGQLNRYLHANPSLILRKLYSSTQQSQSLQPQGEHSTCSNHPHDNSSDLPLLGVQPIPLLVG